MDGQAARDLKCHVSVGLGRSGPEWRVSLTPTEIARDSVGRSILSGDLGISGTVGVLMDVTERAGPRLGEHLGFPSPSGAFGCVPLPLQFITAAI